MMSHPNAVWPFPKPESRNTLLELSQEKKYVCPYCYKEHDSSNGTGTDILCCGELGHCQPETE